MASEIVATVSKLGIAFLFVSLVFLSLGFLLGRRFSPCKEARESYYRAIFDLYKVAMGAPPDVALEAARGSRDKQWFRNESPGWEWPLQDE